MDMLKTTKYLTQMEVFLIYHLWLDSGFGKEITKHRERMRGKQKILVMAVVFGF